MLAGPFYFKEESRMKHIKYHDTYYAYKDGYIYGKDGHMQKVEECPICRRLYDTPEELYKHMHSDHIVRIWHGIEIFQP